MGKLLPKPDLILKCWQLQVIPAGGVCLVCGDVVFCGDTVFAESIGRTDLPGGSYKQILNSIKDKILVLPDETKLLPGHGPATTVGWERRRNPFLQ